MTISIGLNSGCRYTFLDLKTLKVVMVNWRKIELLRWYINPELIAQPSELKSLISSEF